MGTSVALAGRVGSGVVACSSEDRRAPYSSFSLVWGSGEPPPPGSQPTSHTPPSLPSEAGLLSSFPPHGTPQPRSQVTPPFSESCLALIPLVSLTQPAPPGANRLPAARGYYSTSQHPEPHSLHRANPGGCSRRCALVASACPRPWCRSRGCSLAVSTRDAGVAAGPTSFRGSLCCCSRAENLALAPCLPRRGPHQCAVYCFCQIIHADVNECETQLCSQQSPFHTSPCPALCAGVSVYSPAGNFPSAGWSSSPHGPNSCCQQAPTPPWFP